MLRSVLGLTTGDERKLLNGALGLCSASDKAHVGLILVVGKEPKLNAASRPSRRRPEPEKASKRFGGVLTHVARNEARLLIRFRNFTYKHAAS